MPNQTKSQSILSLFSRSKPTKPSLPSLAVFIGYDAIGNPQIQDLAIAPHLMVSGSATGSGINQMMHQLLLSIMLHNTPDKVKFLFHDCHKVDYLEYKGSPFLWDSGMDSDSQLFLDTLEKLTDEIYKRLELFAEAEVQDILSYNSLYTSSHSYETIPPYFSKNQLPYIVVVVDDVVELEWMDATKAETILTTIGEKGKQAGVHMILSARSFSEGKLSTKLLAYCPTIIALKTYDEENSKILTGGLEATKLNGYGDCLIKWNGSLNSELVRAQGIFVGEYISDMNKEFKEEYLTLGGYPSKPVLNDDEWLGTFEKHSRYELKRKRKR